MPRKRRHRRSVSLPELEALSPLTVKTTQNQSQVKEIAESQAAFGGVVRARVKYEKVQRQSQLSVIILYTASRVRIGALDNQLAAPLMRKTRWLALLNRVATCEAVIDNDPASSAYLDVTLTPLKSQSRPTTAPVRN